MLAVKQMKPWRYQLDAPFQRNPNEVHSLRKTLSVGTAASMSRQDIVVVDVALYTMNKTTDLQNLGELPGTLSLNEPNKLFFPNH